ncbi:MAG: M48 family metalloprotease [Ignisphaera sp.]
MTILLIATAKRLKVHLWWLYSSKIDDPSIHKLARDVAQIIGVKPFKNIRVSTRFYIANAAVIGFRCRTLVLTNLLLDILSVNELRAVFLHEYAHCKLKHQIKLLGISFILMLFMALTAILITQTIENDLMVVGIGIPFLILAYLVVILITRLITKRFELEADCLAVSKLENPYLYIELLKKIKNINGEVRGWRTLLSPHPPIDVRIAYAIKCIEGFSRIENF